MQLCTSLQAVRVFKPTILTTMMYGVASRDSQSWFGRRRYLGTAEHTLTTTRTIKHPPGDVRRSGYSGCRVLSMVPKYGSGFALSNEQQCRVVSTPQGCLSNLTGGRGVYLAIGELDQSALFYRVLTGSRGTAHPRSWSTGKRTFRLRSYLCAPSNVVSPDVSCRV